MNIGVVVNSLLVIFGMIAVGVLVGKTKVISERASGDFTALLMNVTLPCTIFSSMIREYESRLLRDSAVIFVLGLIFFAGGLLISQRLAKLFRVRREVRSVWVLCVSLCNTGFMGFPIVSALFGDDGLFLAAMMNLAYNVVAFSLGIRIFREDSKVEWRKIFLTPNTCAVVLGLICFLTQLSIPSPIFTVISDFAAVTTPLSMFLIGLSLAGGSLLEVFRDKNVLSITVLRLVVMPLLVLVILKLLPLPEGSLIGGVAAVIMAMPCPSLGMIFAQEYGGDTVLAARAIFFSTLCCIVTIPLFLLLV